jgi:hypothetical protein
MPLSVRSSAYLDHSMDYVRGGGGRMRIAEEEKLLVRGREGGGMQDDLTVDFF